MTPRFVEQWSALCGDRELAGLTADRPRLAAFMAGHHLIDVVRSRPVPGLAPQDFVRALRGLQPRLYSIASSTAFAPDEAHVWLSPDERLKAGSNYLRGTIVDSLADPVTGSVLETDTKLMKFHGIYQQDDRDLRDERRQQKLEPAYQFMIRVRLAGGVCTPEQWLKLTDLATTYGNATLRADDAPDLPVPRRAERQAEADAAGPARGAARCDRRLRRRRPRRHVVGQPASVGAAPGGLGARAAYVRCGDSAAAGLPRDLAYGWNRGSDGAWHYTLFVENGRVADRDGRRLMTALREIARVPARQRARIVNLLETHGLGDAVRASPLRLNAMACVALPTCGLAMAESERYLPSLVTAAEALLRRHGLQDEPIVMRMTGCPNGCARPYVAEIAFTGRAPGKYNMYLGGGAHGQRLNRMVLENIGEERILAELDGLFGRFARERRDGERIGDFAVRAGYVRAVTSGRDFNA